MGQPPELGPQRDTKTEQEAEEQKKKSERGGVGDWNRPSKRETKETEPATGQEQQTAERDAALEPEERRERARIAHPENGVGFGFGESKLRPGELRRLVDGLSPERRHELLHGKGQISIVGMASRPGRHSLNQSLSEARAEDVKQALIQDYGIDASRIVTKGVGESWSKEWHPGVGMENVDFSEERMAFIGFEMPAGARGPGPERDAGGAGRAAGDVAKPPSPPERYTVGQGITDGLVDVLVNLLSEAAGAAKTAVDMTVKVFGTIGEAHEKNREASVARGAQYAVAVLSGDARNPENAHVARGQPYTAEGLTSRVRHTFRAEIDREMPYLKVENSEAERQLQQGVDAVVKQLNPVMGKARSASERAQVLRAFVDAASRRMSDLHRR